MKELKAKMVKIKYRDTKKVIFFGRKGTETVYRRKARKRHLCNEAKNHGISRTPFIEPGEYYFEDHIRYVKRRTYGSGYVYYHTTKICTTCWKGPRPIGC